MVSSRLHRQRTFSSSSLFYCVSWMRSVGEVELLIRRRERWVGSHEIRSSGSGSREEGRGIGMMEGLERVRAVTNQNACRVVYSSLMRSRVLLQMILPTKFFTTVSAGEGTEA